MENSSSSEADARARSDEAIRWLVRLQSGMATPDDCAACAAWRAASPDHERAFREAQEMWSLASGLTQDSIDERAEVQPAATIRSRAPRKQLFAAAASISLAIGVALWAAGGTAPLVNDYSAAFGERRSVELPDGSEVRLNAGAAIDVDFSAGSRQVTLNTGQAFFQVTRDERGRPFVVTANGTSVTVLGTAFEVDRRSDGGVAVAVSEHAVGVRSPEGQTSVVDEGERMLVDASGHIGGVASLEISRVAPWRTGRLIAEGQRLDEVVAALSKYHRGWIAISDADAARLSVSAVLELAETGESLRILAAAVPIRVRTITPYFVVISSEERSSTY